ncbi:MAG: ADP-glyceromanno-heptose 6-epimerase [Fimbriimonadaceae bacterium]|nr:ADP-glyceromanno-heptose 6-epimerase [Chitinophagales bacterium]
MIIITGAAGFIGSCLIAKCNQAGFNNIVIVDDFTKEEKNKNLIGKKYFLKIQKENFISWFKNNAPDIHLVFHIGARTDTTEFNAELLAALNTNYSKEIWEICTAYQIPFIYASSAATYGAGESGYDDAHDLIKKLHPLNPYGVSKNEFDKFVLSAAKDLHSTKNFKTPPNWYGLKFFNVYGPNEYHKKRMASVMFHAFNQFQSTGKVKLFRSHNSDFEDGKQLRDFIYVQDVLDVIMWLMQNKPGNGIYNLGTGTARTFYDLAKATAEAMRIPLEIEWIDIPEDIRDKYQYFTEAKMEKLFSAGYTKSFYSLEDGIKDYVQNYLQKGSFY